MPAEMMDRVCLQLFGLPGSGKTHSAAEIAATQQAQLVALPKRTRRYWLCLRFLLRRPSRSGLLLATLLLETGLKPRLLVYKLRILIGCLAKEQAALSIRRAVIDMGLVQYTLTFYERPITASDLRTLARILAGEPYVICTFEVSLRTRARRLESRGGLPRDQFGNDYALAWQVISEANFDLICEFLRTQFVCFDVCNDDQTGA